MINAISIKKRLLALLLLAASQVHAEPTGAEVMERSLAALRPKGMTADVQLTIIESNSDRRVLKLKVLSKLQDDALHSSIRAKFLSPPDLRDTVFLQVQGDGANDASWVFLPALRKVRRLPSAEKKNSFFGSDFTYGDVLPLSLAPFTHKLLKEESLDGERCWVVESTSVDPRTSEELGYHRRLSWIDASSYVDRKTEYFSAQGSKLRVQKASDPKQVGAASNTWVMQRREMLQQDSGRRTLLEYQHIDNASALSNQLFSSRAMTDSQ